MFFAAALFFVLMVAADAWLSPPALARRARINVEKILHWIATGELTAIDLSTDRAQRPRWKIRPEDWEEFCQRRANGEAPKPKPGRGRQEQSERKITQYY